MIFLRLKMFIFSISITLLFARSSVAVVFLLHDDWQAFMILVAMQCFAFLTVLTTHFFGKYNLPRRLYLYLRSTIDALKSSPNAKYRLLKPIYYHICKNRLQDRTKFKHILWICFEIELLSTALIFVLLRGWGYGFELYLFIPIAFFYLNFRFKSSHVHIIPIFFLLVFVILFLLANHLENAPAQLLIYTLNGCFTLIFLFVIQIVCAVGKVIKTINDNNRCEYLRSLSSYDALTNTLHKYSFLDVASARLEHGPQEGHIMQASIILIEFLNLAAINKKFTVQIVDVVLREFAYLIKQYCENYDCHISRWSGSEFAILLINEDEQVARMLAELLCKEAALNRFSIKGIRVNCKYGVASNLKANCELGELIDLATLELKTQKELAEKEDANASKWQ